MLENIGQPSRWSKFKKPILLLLSLVQWVSASVTSAVLLHKDELNLGGRGTCAGGRSTPKAYFHSITHAGDWP